MTAFETRWGLILLYEPEPLDEWIGQSIQQDTASGRYKNVSKGDWLTETEAKAYLPSLC